MEYIHGTIIYLATQTTRPAQVAAAVSNWGARHAEFDSAPEVVDHGVGRYGPTEAWMTVHIWFGNDVVADRAEADDAWAAINGLALGWVRAGSLIQQGTDSTDPTTIIQTRSF